MLPVFGFNNYTCEIHMQAIAWIQVLYRCTLLTYTALRHAYCRTKISKSQIV